MTWWLNSLQLTSTNDIYLNVEPKFPTSPSVNTSLNSDGVTSRVSEYSNGVVKISFGGLCTTETGIRNLMQYDSNNYDWTLDSDDLYLKLDLTRQWKVGLISVNTTIERSIYSFTMDIYLDTVYSEGVTQTTKSGSATTSPTSITGISQSGDKNSYFDSLVFTGVYAGGANATSINVYDSILGYTLNVADEILDSAVYALYDDLTAYHEYNDALSSDTLFARNKYDSSGVTFDTDHLVFANSSYLTYKFQLTHPLLQDPELCLIVSSLVSDPIIEVSPDNTTYWQIGKDLESGFSFYPLDQLAGYSTFYIKITCDSGDSFDLSEYKLMSWHDYSGQKPIFYIDTSGVAKSLSLSFSTGNVDYEFKYRNKNTF